MRTSKTTRCASCKRRIRAHEPDALLEDVAGGGKTRFYHLATCSAAAYAKASERPGVYVLTVRSVDASRN